MIYFKKGVPKWQMTQLTFQNTKGERNQILDNNNQCLCDNGQLPNMTRQCSKYFFFSYDLQ